MKIQIVFPSKILIGSKKIHCVAGAQNMSLCVTTGEDGKNQTLPQMLTTHIAPVESLLKVRFHCVSPYLFKSFLTYLGIFVQS